MSVGTRSIVELESWVQLLQPDHAAIFNDMYTLVTTHGHIEPPPEMEDWIESTFGAHADVKSQDIVNVTNRWTLEGSLFNELRARRPIAAKSAAASSVSLEGDGTDPFCRPLTGTPTDTFGRVQGERSVTASNVAKYDGLHGVVIFDRHNPLEWDEASILDAFKTGLTWLQMAHKAYPAAVYPFLMWNCLPRSGASLIHGHMQTTLGEGAAYARIEAWRRGAEGYAARTGGYYFDDLYSVHAGLGLARTLRNLRLLAHLTPIKEKECIVLAPAFDVELFTAVHKLITLYRDGLGVGAFNLAVYMPPLGLVSESWEGFPVVVRLVDRGDPAGATSDIGAMELFAQPVVSFDPYRLAEALATL